MWKSEITLPHAFEWSELYSRVGKASWTRLILYFTAMDSHHRPMTTNEPFWAEFIFTNTARINDILISLTGGRKQCPFFISSIKLQLKRHYGAQAIFFSPHIRFVRIIQSPMLIIPTTFLPAAWTSGIMRHQPGRWFRNFSIWFNKFYKVSYSDFVVQFCKIYLHTILHFWVIKSKIACIHKTYPRAHCAYLLGITSQL